MSTQCVENHDDIDDFLQQRAEYRREFTGGKNKHQDQAKANADQDALAGDFKGA